jgi:hypothetical protein
LTQDHFIQKIEDERAARESLDAALARFHTLTESLPLGPSMSDFFSSFRELVRANFNISGSRWLNAFELGAIAKWVYLRGHSRRNTTGDGPSILNSYKEVWRSTEEATVYPDDPPVAATFVLRFVYQQLIWNISYSKMQANFTRIRGIFTGSSEPSKRLRQKFEQAAGISFDEFLKAAHVMYGLFLEAGGSIPGFQLYEAMLKRLPESTIDGTLRILSVTRGGLRRYYEQRVAVSDAVGFVYELNPLLRYPILYRDDSYWCVYPELINYAATRGLYFFITDFSDAGLNGAFASAFEAYVVDILSAEYGRENILTEEAERSAGWTGKNIDVTAILQNAALLLECKNSGLFSVAKRSADPVEIANDIRKNLANEEKRKGLFQLYDKIQALNTGSLPKALQDKYANVTKYYPVLLLHDEIWFANRPEVMKNLIDEELRVHGIASFCYQIWHVEELELLLKTVPREQLPTVLEEKFNDPRYSSLDLTAYLSGRFGLPDLSISLFLPHGESKALTVLRKLADADNKSATTR